MPRACVAPRGPAAVLVAEHAAASRRSRDRFASVTTWSSSPDGDHPAVAQQQGVGEPGRDLLHVVGDQHGRRRVGVHRQHRQRGHEVLAPAEVEAGGGLVEQQQLGVGHQRPGDLDPLALPLAEGAEGAVGEVLDADLDEQARRPGRGRGRRRPRASARPRRTTRTRPRRAPARGAGSARPGRRWSGRSGAAARRRRRCRAPRRGCRRPPTVGWICAAATCSRVVLPAPLGPRMTQRSSSSTVQSIRSRRVAWPRRTVTSANSSTAVMAVTLSSARTAGPRRTITRREHHPSRLRPPRLVGDVLAARTRGHRPADRRGPGRGRHPRRGRAARARTGPRPWSPRWAGCGPPGATGFGAALPGRGRPGRARRAPGLQRRRPGGRRGRGRRRVRGRPGPAAGGRGHHLGGAAGRAAPAPRRRRGGPRAARRAAGDRRRPGPAGRRPLAARGRRPADEPAAPGGAGRPRRRASPRAWSWPPGACRPSRSSTWPSRTTAAR